MAEIEIAIFQRSCLKQRLADLNVLEQQVQALERERNAQQRRILWQFTTLDARQKLHRLYPVT